MFNRLNPLCALPIVCYELSNSNSCVWQQPDSDTQHCQAEVTNGSFRPRYDLWCVWWDVKPCSMSMSMSDMWYWQIPCII